MHFILFLLRNPKRAATTCGFEWTVIVNSHSLSFLCSLFQNVHIQGVNKRTTIAFLSSTQNRHTISTCGRLDVLNRASSGPQSLLLCLLLVTAITPLTTWSTGNCFLDVFFHSIQTTSSARIYLNVIDPNVNAYLDTTVLQALYFKD